MRLIATLFALLWLFSGDVIAQIDLWQPLHDAVAASAMENVVVFVADRTSPQPLFVHEKGSLRMDSFISFASASKWLAASAIMKVVEEGYLSLDSTPQSVLGNKLWPVTGADDPRGQITLEQLLRFTSGLGFGGGHRSDASEPCTGDGTSTFSECLLSISRANEAELTPPGPPGQAFHYGSNHLHVAAAMAVAARTQSFDSVSAANWSALFEAVIAAPLGYPQATNSSTEYRWMPANNPSIAAGFFARIDLYERWLRAIYLKSRVLNASTIDQMEQAPPDMPTVWSPFQAFGIEARYEMGHWLQCPESMPVGSYSETCVEAKFHSSPGMFGFDPFIDRKLDFYGFVGQFDRIGRAPAIESVHAMESFRPQIETALSSIRIRPTTSPSPTAPASSSPSSSVTSTPLFAERVAVGVDSTSSSAMLIISNSYLLLIAAYALIILCFLNELN